MGESENESVCLTHLLRWGGRGDAVVTMEGMANNCILWRDSHWAALVWFELVLIAKDTGTALE